MEKLPYVTNEAFEKHTAEDMENFQKLRLQNDQIEQERRKRHEELITMIGDINKKLLPVFEAFDFRKRLDERGMKAIVRWTKILGFVILFISICVYGWKIVVFAILQAFKSK